MTADASLTLATISAPSITTLAPVAPVAPDRRVSGGDTLTFVGNIDNILDLARMRGLRSTEHDHFLAVDARGQGFYEAVISRSSPLVGRTIAPSACACRSPSSPRLSPSR